MGKHDTENDAAAVYVAGAVADAKVIEELRQALADATARAEKAERDLEAFRKDAVTKLVEDARLVSMNYSALEGGPEIRVASPLVRVWAEWCKADFERTGAKNYLEHTFTCGTADGDRFTILVQREGGKTPAQIAGDERRRAERYESLYAKAWAEIEYWRDNNGLIIDGKWHNGEYVGNGNYINHPVPNADAHDAARKEAGL